MRRRRILEYVAFLVIFYGALFLIGAVAGIVVTAAWIGYCVGRTVAYGEGLKVGGAIWNYWYLRSVEAHAVEQLAPDHPIRAMIAADLAETAERLPRGLRK